MKKIINLFLALAIVFALAVPAFADDTATFETNTGSADKDVTAKYESEKVDEDLSNVAKVYLVTVDWTVNSTLKYSDGTRTYKWNAGDTKYEEVDPTDDGWEGSASVTINVTNKSNDAIKATASWEAKNGITVDCSFDEETVDVASAAANATIQNPNGAAVIKTITATIDKPTAGKITTDNAVVGTITVEIAAAN